VRRYLAADAWLAEDVTLIRPVGAGRSGVLSEALGARPVVPSVHAVSSMALSLAIGRHDPG